MFISSYFLAHGKFDYLCFVPVALHVMCVYVDVNKFFVISAFKTPLYLYAQVKRNLEIVQTRCMQISAEIVSKSKPDDLYHTVHYYCVVGIMEVWVFLLKLAPNNQPHFTFPL